MESELARLKFQLHCLQAYAAFSSLLLVYLLVRVRAARSQGVLRARGLVIEDAQGRDRILLGAPIPESRHRLRTDLERVRQHWASRLGGEKYMEDYATYNHDVSGVVFLNEQGYDKLILGEKTPDPNTGKRLVEAAGLTLNDDEGFERGGLGISRTEGGEYRVTLGMDDPKLGEAVHLFVLEDGTKGLRIAYEDGQLLLGRLKPDNEIFARAEEFSGVRMVDPDGKVLWEHNVLPRK